MYHLLYHAQTHTNTLYIYIYLHCTWKQSKREKKSKVVFHTVAAHIAHEILYSVRCPKISVFETFMHTKRGEKKNF